MSDYLNQFDMFNKALYRTFDNDPTRAKEEPEITELDEESAVDDVLASWEKGKDTYGFGEYLAETWLDAVRQEYIDKKITGSLTYEIEEAARKLVSGWDSDNWDFWRHINGDES